MTQILHGSVGVLGSDYAPRCRLITSQLPLYALYSGLNCGSQGGTVVLFDDTGEKFPGIEQALTKVDILRIENLSTE
jgi:hypothetical protein